MSQKARVFSFDYVVKDSEGKEIDSSEPGQPLMFIEGSGQIIPTLESEIKNLKIGDNKHIALTAVNAYGEIDKNLVMDIPLTQLPPVDSLKIGDNFWAETEGGRRPFRVVKISDTHATMDGNHPLAGQDLSFDVKLIEIRDATDEELQHGHAHGPGGHHH